MMRLPKQLGLAAVATLGSWGSPLFAQAYNVDFGANNVFPVPSMGFTIPPCQSCGGVWNAVSASVLNPTALLDANGVDAGVTITHVGGQGNYQFDAGATPSGSDLEKLVDDLQNVGPVGSTSTWTLHGVPNGIYNINVFAWAPDDPTQLTQVSCSEGLFGPRVCGGLVNQPWTWNFANYAWNQVGVTNGELSFSALAVQGFGSLNGFQIFPAFCGFYTGQFCTAKVNSLGCTPTWAHSGIASASATSGFALSVTQIVNQKPGLMLYGTSGPDSIPFQGGTLCVKTPISRTIPSNSGGSGPTISDCTGNYHIDMNAFAAGLLGGTPKPALRVPGTRVTCQWWGRDPGFAPPNNTTLSKGLQYFVCP